MAYATEWRGQKGLPTITQLARTLVEVIRAHACTRGSSPALTFVRALTEPPVTLSYTELDRRAHAIGSELFRRGRAGAPVIVVCPPGIDYVVALFGCLYAGAIAVPLPPPGRSSLSRALVRMRALLADSRAELALTTAHLSREWLDAGWPGAGEIELISVDDGDFELVDLPTNEPASPALIQYTSGSTSQPKGVLITHANLLQNERMIHAAGGFSPDDTGVTWLPPYHDMGLMGGILQPLFVGGHGVLLQTETFARHPLDWLSLITRYRAVATAGPNFAFDACVRAAARVGTEGIDLSSLKIVYCGAEPIRSASLAAFARLFAPRGFANAAFCPCYGMAEATLIISGGDPNAEPVVRQYAAEELERGRAELAENAVPSRPFVGCGHALLDERILIVDPQTLTPLAPRQVGEIWVQSQSVALGYWNRPEETEQTFRAFTSEGEGPFLRTGDLGFFDEGELFITGRLKDLIILRGLNHYPQDIERTVQGVDDALVTDAGAAFAIERDGSEQLVVVQELDKRHGADANALMRRIPEAIRAEHDVTPFAVVLIKRGSMLKTSSGKVQRRATRDAYLRGELQITASWQIDAAEPAARDEQAESTETVPPSRTRLRPVAASRRERAIVDWLRAHIAEKLKRDPLEIDTHEPLARYGIDSLAAAELTEALEQWLGRELPSTISYDNPTIASLARTLSESGRDSTQRVRRATPEPAASASAVQDDPIAIVGMACRFPGAPDLKAFWNVLRHGVDAIEEVPRQRWDADALYDPRPGVPGKMCSKWGGFVEGIDQFDAAFFGISAREAARMDPQQRMFLELAWAALEDAGQAPLALAGTRTGVFAGVCSNDYATLYGRDLDLIDADYGTGNAPSIVANRLSYVLDLKGPSETIDSACSSSLVALAHALSNLRARDCDTAIVGGVNAVLAPESSIYFSHARMLAQDGRCKTFDSRADGFVRSEGGGVVVLKRLSQAIADGDRVYALVAGGAVNHDGRSNGLLAPNGLAQQDVIQRALTNAGIGAADLDYLEAHGVGSPVADAVELHALGAVLGDRSPLEPLLVGSAKTNVGHLEAAAGMVSLIKVALALHHEEIPAHLHLRDPHPDSDLEALPIEVPTVAVPWKRGERPRFAGASAFGFGGANAHVVLREAPLQAQAEATLDRPRHVVALSAKSNAALRQLAARLAHRLAGARGESLGDIAFSANAGRSHFAHRIAVVAPHATELRERLEHFAHGARDLRVHAAQRKPGSRLLAAFVFGDAVATPGLGRALYERQPQFKQALDLCDRLLHDDLERPLLDVLYGNDSDNAQRLATPSYAHAACVSLQYALHSLVRAWGIEPLAVYGAGAGEYAAAAASGVLSWEQAIKLATRRGLVHEGLTPNAVQRCTLRQLKSELAAVDWLAPSVPFVSAALGRAFTLDEVPDQTHFAQQLYHAPKPSDGRVALLAEGCETYLELGPSSSFDARAHAPAGAWLVTLGDDDWQTLLDAVAALYVAGAEVDWRAFDAPYARRKLSLPAYPFERERHWLEFRDRSGTAPEANVMVERASSHPLISRVRVRSTTPSSAAPLQSDVAPIGDGPRERDAGS